MKTHKVLLLALIVSAVLSVSAQADDHHANTTGNNGSHVAPAHARAAAPALGSGSGFRSGGGHMIAPSQRFSPMGVRAMPTVYRPRYINSGVASLGQRQFTPGTFSRGNGVAQLENSRDPGIVRNNRENRVGEIQNHGSDSVGQFENRRTRDLGTIQNTGENRVGEIQNTGSDSVGQFENRRTRDLGTIQNTRENHVGSISSGNRGLTGAGTSNHVFAQRSADWQPNWDRRFDHWWNGHRCRFVNGSWFIFDLGFFPWYGYPYDYYGYDSYYPYPYPYGYDPGVYEGDNSYYDQGTYDSSDQYTDSSVAAAQEQLAREGYYRGQIDGVFGPETRSAIVRYQSDHGLQPTGYLTMETRQSLGLRQGAGY